MENVLNIAVTIWQKLSSNKIFYQNKQKFFSDINFISNINKILNATLTKYKVYVKIHTYNIYGSL